MARRRNQPRSVRSARDEARARALGYQSYYDYRLHDSGRLPPSAPVPPRGQRQEVRGHRGETRAFRSYIRSGDVILCDVRAVDRDPNTGVYRLIEKQVLPPIGRGIRVREDRFFELRDLTRRELAALIDYEKEVGVVFSPSPSLDQSRLISGNE